MTLTVRSNEDLVEWSIQDGPDEDSLIIPPNCEVIRQFSIDIQADAVVEAKELVEGVYTARTIVNGQIPLIRVLNTTNETKRISKKIEATSIDEFEFIDAKPKISNKRKKELRRILKKTTHKNAPEKLFELCEKFSDIFLLEGDQMTVNNFYSQEIRLNDKNPVYIKNYRLPMSHKKEIEKQVKNLIKHKLIEPSTSNYNSPVIIVPKKSSDGEKKYRMCIDYRQVNKRLLADKYPLNRIDEILDGLGRARFFSVIDLFSGFHQIPLKKESRDITSFSTPQGSFRWKVLPFGLNISPNSFTRMMNIAFTGLTTEQCFIYMDDIIVIGKSEADHLRNLTKVFETCKKYNLKLNPEKCQFFRAEVTYLGHRCTNQGVLPDSKKLSAVANYPVPHDKDSTRRFVAFANYYRKFIQNFALIAKPLNTLTKKNTNFKWDNNCQKAFEKLKNCLINPPILAYPDFTKQFVITVDASALGCGAVLSQIINGMDKPISFASKSFNHAESKRAPIEQELTGIHWSIKHFRPYIFETEFKIRSDHKPLVHLYSLKDPASRLTRMRLDLEEFNFTIEYIKGKKNVCADALSRISFKDIKNMVEGETKNEKILVMTRSMTKKSKENNAKKPQQMNEIDAILESPKIIEAMNYKEYKKVPIIRLQFRENSTGPKVKQISVITKIFSSNKGRLISSFYIEFHDLDQFLIKWFKCLQIEAMKYNVEKLIIDDKNELFEHININNFKDLGRKVIKDLIIIIRETPKIINNNDEKREIIKQFHENPIIGGHAGRNRLFFKIRAKYRWKNMSRDIRNYVNQCHECQMNKAKTKNIEPMKITDTPGKSMDKIIIDTIGPLPKSFNGNHYAVTIVDDLTKYLVMIAIPNKEAKTVARAIFDNYILIYGPMRTIISDCGTEYVNQVSRELFQLFKINHKTSTPYRHQTLGSIERTHRVFNEYLRSYLKEESDWETNMKYFTFCYNITPHTTFNYQYTPFELTFGKKLQEIEMLNQNVVDPIYNVEDLAKEIKFRLQTAQKRAAELIIKAKENNKKEYDKNTRSIEIQINDKVILVDGSRNKFDPYYTGPYVVKEIMDQNVEIIDINNNNKTKIVHKNNIRKYMS